MAIRSSSSKRPISPSSISLEKILKTQQNLSKSSPSIWNKSEAKSKTSDQESPQTLNLTHPILRVLESCKHSLLEFNQVLAQLIVSGLLQHPLAASRAVKKLCSLPSLISHAVYLFNYLDQPDAFICNTIIRSYVNSNDPDGAIAFYYRKMVEIDVPPNHYTFPLLVKVCAELGSVREGGKAHARIVKLGFETDLFVRNAMIHMYGQFGSIGDTRKVFDASPESDSVTWNSMIDGYVKNGEVGKAREVFDEMPERDIVSWNSMIAGYVSVEDVSAAKELFDAMPFRDVVSWNSMIDGYARIGNVSAARGLFGRMHGRSTVSWNTMLALHARSKNYVECIRLFDRMIEGGEVKPNEATLVSVLTACANLGKLDMGKRIHSYIKADNRIELDVLLSTALLTMYAKCGAMDSAREVFLEMPERNTVSWNSMIRWYSMHGDSAKALEMFMEMEKSGPTPNEVTFVCVLSACGHAGLVLEGWWYFDLMQRVYNIKPKVEHYGCMVDLLSRAGLIGDSVELTSDMTMGAGTTLWSALLSACRAHSNFKLGEILGKRLIALEPTDVGPYVLLSNIYAMQGKWDDVENVRKMIEEEGLHKSTGHSVVDPAGSNSSQSILEKGDIPKYRKSLVYSMLSEMGAQVKLSHRE
ncbi:hypothetical protein Scep_025965 [Stephania cephalantha]|uniref:Chlororespiratory reduction 4 n=1 Tax=Stephania cephalantha TaxID=152367 RepID=A0AAP0EJ90_9MAGN